MIHDHIVTQHGHIFVFKYVTLIPVHDHMRLEGHRNFDAFGRPYQDRIFQSDVTCT